MRQRWRDIIDVEGLRLVIRISGWNFAIFDEGPLAHGEAGGGDPDGFGRHQPNFEDWHMNHEIALLMVMQKLSQG